MTPEELLHKAFWSSVDKTTTPDGCWFWTAKLRPNGYGVMNVGHKSIKAHRLSWLVNNGDLPANLLVCYICDNPKCVRPDHLFLGTNADNMADMTRKGRRKTGKGGKAVNRTPDSVRQTAVELRKAGLSFTAIAQELKLCAATVADICKTSGACRLTTSPRPVGSNEIALIRCAYKHGYKTSEVAEALGRPQKTVHRVVRQLGRYQGVVSEDIADSSSTFRALLEKLKVIRGKAATKGN